MLFSELRKLFNSNRIVVYVLLVFTVLGYGYFITHWAISIDSEFHTFGNAQGIAMSENWIAQGRFFMPLSKYPNQPTYITVLERYAKCDSYIYQCDSLDA